MVSQLLNTGFPVLFGKTFPALFCENPMFMYGNAPGFLSPLPIYAKIHVLGGGGFQRAGFQ